MGQNAPTPRDKNWGTVHCDRNSDAPSYKTAPRLQICPKKSTFGGFPMKIFPKFERTGQKVPRVGIVTAAGTTTSFVPRAALLACNPTWFTCCTDGTKLGSPPVPAYIYMYTHTHTHTHTHICVCVCGISTAVYLPSCKVGGGVAEGCRDPPPYVEGGACVFEG